MNTVEWLQHLSIQGWQFWAENGRLRYRAPKDDAEETITSVLAKLKAQKAEILDILQDTPDVANVYPLSHGQRSLWFLWQLAPESAAYNLGYAGRIRSKIDISGLEKSFQILAQRHSVLTNVFPRLDKEPVQQARSLSAIAIEQIDAATWSEIELETNVTAAYRRPFDLENGPIIRVQLFTRSSEDHVLLLVIHHIACDAWSIGVLLEELKTLYPAISQGLPNPLPPLKYAYRDYISWQQQMLTSSEGESSGHYWHQQLAGELPVLNLPTDYPRPPVQTYHGASYPITISEALTQQLKQLARQTGVTLYTLSLAVFNVLLHRYTGQDEILVGTPTSGRSRSEFASLLGFFVNPITMRNNLPGNVTFKEFLGQVRQTVLSALSHQDYPLPLLIERLELRRNASYSPLFQVSFALQNLRQSQDLKALHLHQTSASVNWGGLELEPFLTLQQEGHFDLSLEMVEANSTLTGHFKYNTDLFEEQTIARLEQHFQTLLAAIVADPDAPIGKLPIVTDSEREQLLILWSGASTVQSLKSKQCLPDCFEAQVKKTPNRLAVVCGDQTLTYRELDHQADQLASYLQQLGVGPDKLVGLYLPRCLDLIVGIIAIWKAGGAYVPLDPNYPAERSAYILEDSQVSVLLTHKELQTNVSPSEILPEQKIICLDRDWETIAGANSQPVSRLTLKPGHLAYVIYTSGSTGQPNGVMVEHSSAINLCEGLEQRLYADYSGIPLQVSVNGSIAFDTSVKQIVQLLQGRTLNVIPDSVRLDSHALHAYLERYPVDVFECTPSQLELLRTGGWLVDSGPYPKMILLGGEAISESTWQLLAQSGSTRFFNLYGPTECTVDATVAEIKVTAAKPMLGTPLPNVTVYVLDSYRQPAPIGVIGELYIGGAGVARGYLNHPKRSQDRFIDNPFQPQTRLYRTGDLARYRPDGRLEFLGRTDDQVKIRGFRIELGEVESALSQHSQVKEAVAALREDQPGIKRLVGYVVPQTENVFSPEAVRRFLKQHLPEHMVPLVVVPLKHLPMTPNGKIDRQALPVPDTVSRALETPFVAPRTPIEITLAQTWQEVLGVKQVGGQDNFFELGGDSILAIQIIGRAKQAGLKISPRLLFQYQTIAELASLAQSAPVIQAEQGLITGPVDLTPIQQRFFEHGHHNHFNQSVLLEVGTALDTQTLQQALDVLVAHHDALRLRFTLQDGEWQAVNAGYLENIQKAVQIVDLSASTAEQQTVAMQARIAEVQSSLNITTGPILKACLFYLGEGQTGRLLLTLHHLVVDGVSWRILLDDLNLAYGQVAQEQPVQLPPKTTAFQTWSRQLRAFAQTSQPLLAEAGFWLTMGDTADPLPVDYADGLIANTEASARQLSVTLGQTQTRELLQDVPATYNTQINDLLLTALLLSFRAWAGVRSLHIDLEGHGREDLLEGVDLSRTVGWFTTVFPVQLSLGTITEPGEAIKVLKEQLRQIPQQGIGYGLLRYLCPDLDLRQRLQQRPIAPISFNYLGQFDQLQPTDSDLVLGLAPESVGPLRDPQAHRQHLLDITGQVLDGQLQIIWTYSDQVHKTATIEALADQYLQTLQQLIEHCLSADAGGFTPSDFPLVNLDQTQLDRLLLSRQPIADLYPLSPVQEGMLFHSLYTPGSSVYFEQFNITLEGELNISAFQQAWQQVVNHYPILRTTFITELEQPLQAVCQQVSIPWTLLDWREVPAVQQTEQLQTLLQQDIVQGFSWEQVPLRFTLIQRSHSQVQFIWSFHHILFDGWCLPRLIESVLSCYEAICKGTRSVLPTVRPYRDYIAWLQRQDRAQAKIFWQGQLAGFEAPTPLGIDQASTSSRQTGKRAVEAHQTLPSSLTAALKTLAQQHRFTLYTLLQGAWALLLSHYSGESDVVFGTTVSGRTPDIEGIESMIGLFINTLPVRTQVSDDTVLLDWLAQLQTQQVEREHYAATALVDIQGYSEVHRELPLFESLLVFENYPVDAALQDKQTGGLVLKELVFFEQTNYPLALIATPAPEFSLRVSYDPERFDAISIEKLLSHLHYLLASMVDNPTGQLGELTLLSESERQQIVVGWNQTRRAYPTDGCVHHWVENQVRQTPDAIALCYEEQQLTYHELNTQANQLAHYLQSLGVGPEVPVGICVQRSLKMAVGVLAILKAGGGYVPLDPNYPEERLKFMLSDTQAPILLVDSQTQQKLPFDLLQQRQVVVVDQDWLTISQQPETNPLTLVEPTNLLYIIYTSGSTGRPKGIPIAHDALGNLIQWHLETLEPGGILQFASLSFDASFHEIFAAWCAGDTLYLIPEELCQDTEKLIHFLSDHPVQKVILPVALWQQMTEMYGQQPQLFEQLTAVITTGEQLQITQAMIELAKKLPQCRFHNHYGPSETHVVTAYTFSPDADAWPLYPPIGQPIANTQIYVLDSRFEPVPVGVPGFLWIGGANLARGYLHRPVLTAEKFIPNPFGPGRLYQTGDRARYLPDGQIEFLGRVDDQVKIRGFRIELGEVEAVLNKCPTISQGIVQVYGTSSSHRQLVAYLVANHDQPLVVENVRQFLQQRLPAYMIPSVFMELETLPLTANRKIDRRALPKPNLSSAIQRAYTPPRTPTEEVMVNIFADILDIDRVGIHDNFFDLGGHSLLATRIVSRMRAAFQLDIPLRSLFEAPTVAELGQVVQDLQHTEETPPPSIDAVSRNHNLPLSWAQERLWFLDKLEGASLTNNMPSAVEINGLLNISVLEEALTKLIERHEILRTCFPTVNNSPVQSIIPAIPITVPIDDWSKLPSSEQQTAIQTRLDQEMKQSFNLTDGPLMRLQLIQLGEHHYVLIITFHHAIYDAWSGSIFIQELAELYRSYLRQSLPTLPPLPIQYADFALWQRQWLQGPCLEQQLHYWRQQLGGSLPILQFPMDYSQPTVQDYRGLQETFLLEVSLTDQLKALSQKAGATLFMTLLSAFKVLLARHTGQEDIIVGTPIAGRNHLGTENLIGFFINTLPLRTDLSGNPSFQTLLARVRDVTLGAYGHQDLPFVKLVETLQPERSLNRHPIFDVMFNFINTPDSPLDISGLTFKPLSLNETESRFLMTLYLQEQADGLKIRLVYRQSLFAPERMRLLMAQFRCLLEQVAIAPDTGIYSYSLANTWREDDLQKILPDPKDAIPEPFYPPIINDVLTWAKKHPTYTALRQGTSEWTYQQLVSQSQQIALHLKHQGLQTGDAVALCGLRSFGFIASMLGILQSGGVLVTVDPTLPRQRQQVILEQSQTKYLVIVGKLANSVVLEQPLPVVQVDPVNTTSLASVDDVPLHNELPTLQPDDLAYIFFTSGSTGTPKAMLGIHKGISHFIQWQRETFKIGPDDRVAQLIRPSFDAILRDVFLPLSSGATLCLPNTEADLAPKNLLHWLEQEKISLLHTVPTIAQNWLVSVPEPPNLKSLRWIFLSGEPLTDALVQQWRQTFPESGQIVNLYGSSETTMIKCFYPIPDKILRGVQPAGWPLPQTQALIVNSDQQCCGIGEVGEIVIRTPFRTLGYLNAPKEQQKRFRPNLFNPDLQDLLFYSGDRGRYRLDGTLEILGRLDDQLKIRGIRIQPGEIESILNQHPSIRESVVAGQQSPPVLVAYLVPNLSDKLDLNELRIYLRRHLPEFLIPANFLTLTELPLIPTGKVDRRALPKPDIVQEDEAEIVAPRNPTEQKIVEIFAEILQREIVSIHDNFFEIGGHSLLAILVCSRLLETFEREVPIRSIFEFPSPAGLSTEIERLLIEDDSTSATPPPITRVSRARRRAVLSSDDDLQLSDSLREEISQKQ
ncbi:amino acid adenylation domain-containing protein [Leptothoe sp. EHU-05/26/07-4]